MKRAFKGDNFNPVGLIVIEMIFARHFYCQLCRLGAGIGKKHRVSKGLVNQHIRQTFLFRDAVKVRHMP